MAALGVAVVGLGWWGRTIVPLLKGSDKLRAVVGVDVQPMSDVGIPVETDFAKALNYPGVEGVILCTPHTQHTEQIVRAAAAGKHVFCEKPLSLTRADVIKAVQACALNGVALAVGHEKRFQPPIPEGFRAARAGE